MTAAPSPRTVGPLRRLRPHRRRARPLRGARAPRRRRRQRRRCRRRQRPRRDRARRREPRRRARGGARFLQRAAASRPTGRARVRRLGPPEHAVGRDPTVRRRARRRGAARVGRVRRRRHERVDLPTPLLPRRAAALHYLSDRSGFSLLYREDGHCLTSSDIGTDLGGPTGCSGSRATPSSPDGPRWSRSSSKSRAGERLAISSRTGALDWLAPGFDAARLALDDRADRARSAIAGSASRAGGGRRHRPRRRRHCDHPGEPASVLSVDAEYLLLGAPRRSSSRRRRRRAPTRSTTRRRTRTSSAPSRANSRHSSCKAMADRHRRPRRRSISARST